MAESNTVNDVDPDLQRPEKRQKLNDDGEDIPAPPGTLGGLIAENLTAPARDYLSEEDDDYVAAPVVPAGGKPTPMYDDQGYPVMSEAWAAVKREYIIPRPVLAPAERMQLREAPKKLSRRQERKQRIKKKEVENANKLCPVVADGRQCPYVEKCLFNHDLDAWLANQEPLPFPDQLCPLFELKGHCSFGFACRYRTCHTRIDVEPESGAKKFVNFTNDEKKSAHKEDEKNQLPRDVALQLRKKKHTWPRADAVVREVLQVLKTKRDSSKPHPDYEKMPPREWKKNVDFRGKLVLAPLTTVGNLPFRRICKKFGADITIGEMALCSNLLTGKASEWALTRRHESEDVFGIQIAGNFADMTARTVELLNAYTDADFIDLNSGCPIDMLYNNGMGCGLMNRPQRMAEAVCSMVRTSTVPVTLKIRAGRDWSDPVAHSEVLPNVEKWGLAAVTIHGRTKNQHYKTEAHWDYVAQCAKLTNIPVIGNGDIYDFEDALQKWSTSGTASLMLARGAIIKPWLFTEIKERRRWDISSQERFELLKEYARMGIEHWGSDAQGIDRVRFFLLNWLSFLHRYIPVGLLERLPHKINQRPPRFSGRDDLETLMGSPDIDDWIKISEMILGPAPKDFTFEPKHQANAYNVSNG